MNILYNDLILLEYSIANHNTNEKVDIKNEV